MKLKNAKLTIFVLGFVNAALTLISSFITNYTAFILFYGITLGFSYGSFYAVPMAISI